MSQDDGRHEKRGQGGRGKPASFDPRTGEVSGSGSGAGGGNPGEDYDSDPQAGGGSLEPPAGGGTRAESVGGPGSGHPLPASEDARQDEIPERAIRDKGHGDDRPETVRGNRTFVEPSGKHYPRGE